MDSKYNSKEVPLGASALSETVQLLTRKIFSTLSLVSATSPTERERHFVELYLLYITTLA